ncbi:type I-B CRISPR-associated endonuclease Cas1b [Syntrophothermus lipocalidus]|uniref:CRISPR-associated endonuclease Cas1 n=1 Tax=Syntrophothermus lipocalidus (strain DSM 12680 / TGB-C1) TaxID=643648 RepID=D7CN22_SYNLT|nr:type I-B CRISPR-associated endonuclease Cas1b [Syntrophothermus lipocalidus]ADI02107.1 CRISPR-associated protein Cas1 [Syntrophothermus lipocalidus DSM 12680]
MGRTYYILRSGRLRRRQNTLYLEQEAEEAKVNRQAIPIEGVDDIYLFGEVDLNTKLLNFLAQNGIVVHCFNYYGFYTGSFYPRESNVSGHLLVKQVEHYLDLERRLTIAREFVASALFHIRRNLNYYKTRGKPVSDCVKVIEECMARLESCKSIPELMREEGRAREAYYHAFNEIVDVEEEFEKRVRRPPNSMLNALMSFVNTLVYTATLSQIYVTQLNPTISYLHEPSHRRFSLALDVAEVFKPLVGDRVLFRLLNKGVISEKDFVGVGDAPAIYMTEDARKRVLREMEETWQTTVYHRVLKRKVSYRHMIRLEAYKIIRHLTGMEPYRSLRAWW